MLRVAKLVSGTVCGRIARPASVRAFTARAATTAADVREETGSRASTFDEELYQDIACPITQRPLVFDSANSELVSTSIGVAYPVKDGIPFLAPSDARIISQ